jgi:hypothetical protein
MPTTACTNNYYTTVVVGYVPGSGTSTGNVVIFNTPPAEWTDSNLNQAKQCNTVELGGFKGLNS